MVNQNGFSLKINKDIPRHISSDINYHNNINDGNYVVLKHLEKYSLVMENNRDRKCDVVVYIDGDKMGKWRINKYDSITIERPSNKKKRFTFVKEDSWEAGVGGIEKGDDKNGVVTATFYPAKQSQSHSLYATRCMPKEKSSGISRGGMSKGMPRGGYTMCDNRAPLQYQSFSSAPVSNAGSLGMTSDFGSGGTVLQGNSDQRFGSVDSITDIDQSNVTELSVRLVVDKRSSPMSMPKPVYKNAIPPRMEESIPSIYGFNNLSDNFRVEPKISARPQPSLWSNFGRGRPKGNHLSR